MRNRKVWETIQANPDNIYLITFGGCGEFGANLTAYCQGSQLCLVDCGILFPSPTMLGIDSIIIQIDEFIQLFSGISSYIMTHGHEDHIGALPHFLEKWPAPVYCRSWTAELLIAKLSRQNKEELTSCLRIVGEREYHKVGQWHIQWIPVNHSIPMTSSLLIQTGSFQIFHTGDFKIDRKPVGEEAFDFAFIESIAQKHPINLLLADSTNATHDGWTPSESIVEKEVYKQIKQASGLTVFTTFSSHLWRILSLISACRAQNKKLMALGTSILRTLDIAVKLKLIETVEDVLINPGQMTSFSRHSIVILATGSQGEPLAALSRIFNNQMPKITLQQNDTIIFSSRTIPGNERAVFELKSRCAYLGIHVRDPQNCPDIHVSGHAYQKDLAWLITALKPKHFLPVHGTHTHLKANEGLHRLHSQQTTLASENGAIFEVSAKGCKRLGKVEGQRQYIDSFSSIPLTKTILNQRLKIGYNGCAVLTGIVDSTKWQASQIQIDFIGCPGIINEQKSQMEQSLATTIGKYPKACPKQLNEICRIQVRNRLKQLLNKKVVVLAKIIVQQ